MDINLTFETSTTSIGLVSIDPGFVEKYIQLTSGERPMYDSTFSSSLSPCSARKTQVRSRKKHRKGKKHVWQQEKKAVQREKAVSAAGKNASKKCRQKMPLRSGKNSKQQKKHLAAAKSTFAAEKMHFGGSGKKPSEAGKTRPRQEKKTAEAGKKHQQQRKPSFATQKVPATEKNTFPQ